MEIFGHVVDCITKKHICESAYDIGYDIYGDEDWFILLKVLKNEFNDILPLMKTKKEKRFIFFLHLELVNLKDLDICRQCIHYISKTKDDLIHTAFALSACDYLENKYKIFGGAIGLTITMPRIGTNKIDCVGFLNDIKLYLKKIPTDVMFDFNQELLDKLSDAKKNTSFENIRVYNDIFILSNIIHQ